MGYTSLKKRVEDIYKNPRAPASFSNPSKLGKHHFKTIKLKEIQTILEGVDAYTKHKPYKRKFPRRSTQTWGIDRQWQLDLIDMQPFKRYNNGYKYILVGVDVFSRYAFAQPVYSKNAQHVLNAFEKMTIDRQPQYIQTDKGTEFTNKNFQTHLKKNSIYFFTSENDDVKCAIAERFNGTLQGKMWRYFTYNNTYRFIDVLQDLVHSYNNTEHRSLGIPPAHVNKNNSESLFYRLYENPEKIKKRTQLVGVGVGLHKPGTKVRILKTKKTFNRGYEPNWTEEIFTIHKTNNSGYIIKDDNGELIKGEFYHPEVQKVKSSRGRQYKIEQVLKYRGKGVRKEAFVKWKGYSEQFNSWEPVKNIKKT